MGVLPAANSRRRCRQPPQHVLMASPSHTVTTATISRSPAATMAEIAPASAHEPCGYAAFSTLQPENTRPLAVRSAAPDGKVRVRRVGLGLNRLRGGEQFFHLGVHQVLTVGTSPLRLYRRPPSIGDGNAPAHADERLARAEQIVVRRQTDEWRLRTRRAAAFDQVHGDTTRRQMIVEAFGGEQLDREESAIVDRDDSQSRTRRSVGRRERRRCRPMPESTTTAEVGIQPAASRLMASVSGPSRRSGCTSRGAALLLIRSIALRFGSLCVSSYPLWGQPSAWPISCSTRSIGGRSPHCDPKSAAPT